MLYWVDTDFSGDMETSDEQPFADLEAAVSWWLSQVDTVQKKWLQSVENSIRNQDMVTTPVCPKLMTKNRLMKTLFRVTFYESDNDTIPDTDSQDSYATITDSEEVRRVPDTKVEDMVAASPGGIELLQKLCEHIDMIARLSQASVHFWSDNQFAFRKMRWYMQRKEDIPFEPPHPQFLDDIHIEHNSEPFVLQTYRGKCMYPDHDDFGHISPV